jgi:prophage DNA circulation protein
VFQHTRARAITEPLKDLALVLQKAALAIIERRPPLIFRTLDGAGNLRLIAHLWYGDHSRAPELARLNNLRLPNALNKGDVLRGYAK